MRILRYTVSHKTVLAQDYREQQRSNVNVFDVADYTKEDLRKRISHNRFLARPNNQRLLFLFGYREKWMLFKNG